MRAAAFRQPGWNQATTGLNVPGHNLIVSALMKPIVVYSRVTCSHRSSRQIFSPRNTREEMRATRRKIVSFKGKPLQSVQWINVGLSQNFDRDLPPLSGKSSETAIFVSSCKVSVTLSLKKKVSSTSKRIFLKCHYWRLTKMLRESSLHDSLKNSRAAAYTESV